MIKLFYLADEETKDRLVQLIVDLEGEFFGEYGDWVETAKEICGIAKSLERKAAKKTKKTPAQPTLFG